MTIQKFEHLRPPPTFSNVTDVQVYVRKLYDSLFKVMQGKVQNVLEVTLAANVASTTVTDARISIQSALLFDPRTANAATELFGGTMYVLDANRGKGTATITHANNAQTDRVFFLSVVG